MCPAARISAAVRAAGARPDPLSAMTSSLPAGFTSAKQSPPIPVIAGSHSPRSTLPAIAASTALPPDCSMSIATFAANGCDVAHIPFSAKTADRPG
jgi:hypothetical protein